MELGHRLKKVRFNGLLTKNQIFSACRKLNQSHISFLMKCVPLSDIIHILILQKLARGIVVSLFTQQLSQIKWNMGWE